jgi:hypothetical protein
MKKTPSMMPAPIVAINSPRLSIAAPRAFDRDKRTDVRQAALRETCYLVHQPAGGLVWGGAPAAGLLRIAAMRYFAMVLIFFGGSIAATIAGISRARR